MTAAREFADPDDADNLLRPAWEDTPDETDADRRTHRPAAKRPPGQGAAVDDLLGPLCAATDAPAPLPPPSRSARA